MDNQLSSCKVVRAADIDADKSKEIVAAGQQEETHIDSPDGGGSPYCTLQDCNNDKEWMADMDDQIAKLNSLTISEQHPLDSRPVSRSMRGIFPDNTAFTPQATDRFLFASEHISVDTSSIGSVPSRHNSVASNPLDPNFMRRPLDPSLIRRESYPCLQNNTNTKLPNGQPTHWSSSYHKQQQQQQDQLLHPMNLRDQMGFTHATPFRKHSMDVPYSLAHKRLDLVENGGRPGRLTPSYSNPDLAAVRRLSSLEHTQRIQQEEYVNQNGAAAAGLVGVSPNQPYSPPLHLLPGNKANTRLSNPPILPPSLSPAAFYPGIINSSAAYAAAAAAAAAATSSAMVNSTAAAGWPSHNNSGGSHLNPWLLSHLMRYMSPQISREPSPSRKSSLNHLQKRHNEDKYASVRFEDMIGDLYSLCKDQYGCRFLQKKLEEQKNDQRDAIFDEVFPHFVELMTDPFGNYLCQKLMEHCTDAQRTMIVEQVAEDVVNISLNMHGTRAVQKMIEFLSLPAQIDRVIAALAPNVVTLIKDLNGNHVIQRCLQRLSSENKQFIYDAVSENCVQVATHRHGCCVLQRCIDFSAEHQKAQLVKEIIHHALTLVQDPFGNYVVQYVMDLGDAQFSDRLIRRFIGHVSSLSSQKFSSNVMEKCIRVAEPETRRLLIEEMTNKSRLEKLLRDSYANYVVQTAMDYAEASQRAKLVECIRPLLPSIRNTPYGKRIQGKINREQQQRQQQLRQQQPVTNTISVSNGALLAPWTSNTGEMAFFGPVQPAYGSVHFSDFHTH